MMGRMSTLRNHLNQTSRVEERQSSILVRKEVRLDLTKDVILDSSSKIRIWSSFEKSAHSLSLGRKENRRYHYDEDEDEYDDER